MRQLLVDLGLPKSCRTHLDRIKVPGKGARQGNLATDRVSTASAIPGSFPGILQFARRLTVSCARGWRYILYRLVLLSRVVSR